MLKSLTELALTDINSQIAACTVVLCSPRLRNRNAFMAAFISSPDTYLHTMTKQESTLSAFASGLVTDLRDFFPDFGSQTLQVLDATSPDLAEALVADLKPLKSAIKTLILDEFDRLSFDDTAATFFEHLVKKLPRDMKLVVNSRTLGWKPWGELVHAGKAVVLGEQTTLDGGIFGSARSDKTYVEVYGFGRGHVYVNGLTVQTWEGPLVRNLFFYFVDHPMITRDEIFETFWSGNTVQEATNTFHVTKRKVTERLGCELTAYSSGLYRPSDEIHIHYDVRTFEQDVAREPEHGSEAIATLHHAIRLYRNEFLHTNEMPWIVERREQLRLMYAGALVSLGRIYTSLHEKERALSLYLRAIREVPEREDIHRDIMTVYEAQGQPGKAVAQYNALQELLQRKFGIAPSTATQTQYNRLIGQSSYRD